MKNQLHALAAALSVGLVWAVGLFIWTLCSVRTGYGTEMLELMSTVYIGYTVTVKGAFVGLVWGFLDGFIGTFIAAKVYNFFVGRLK